MTREIRISSELKREQLDRLTDHGETRYLYYRDHGLEPKEAFRCTLAWQLNMAEQRARRLDHGTGATAAD